MSPLSIGRLTVTWTPASGLSITLDGVPVIRRSTLYLVKAGWSGVLFNPTTARWSETAWRKIGESWLAEASAENESAAVAFEWLVTKTSVTTTLRYRLKQDIPAEIEWAAGYVNANLLEGASVSGDTRLAKIPITPLTGSQEARRIGPPFTKLAFETKLGQVVFGWHGTGTNEKPVCFDARTEAFEWAQAAPTFWLGLGSPARVVRFEGGEQAAVFTVTVGSPPPPGPLLPILRGGGSQSRHDAFVPQVAQTPLVIPTPKKLMVTGPPVRLTNKTKIEVIGPGAERAIALLKNTLPLLSALPPRVGRRGPGGGGIPGGGKPESYTISVRKDRIQLTGNDEAGTLWAAQTLLQLIENNGKNDLIHSVEIEDWPTLGFRGVHLFHGQNALPFQKKLIARLFSPFKLNHLVIQCEQLKWESDPSVAPSWGGTKAAIREQVAFAKVHGITMTPLVQSYGHMEWLFNKPQNRMFAEDPELPYAVNISNPAAVGYLEKLIAEADDLFGAPAFHAGLDEVTMRGRFPFRSAPRTFADLFVSNARHWQAFHKRRGKEMWMWADMALHPSEVVPCFGTAPSVADAKMLRDGLPKDVVMFDWQYGAHDKFPSLKKLHDAGFSRVVACTWFNPGNVANFSKAAADVGAWGGLQTTWCGYESKAEVLDGPERRQFVAMVLAAEHFWNGGATKPKWDAGEVFTRLWSDKSGQPIKPRAGILVQFPGKAREARLSDGVLYRLSSMLLAGKLTEPAPLSLPLELPGTTELRLIVAATHKAERGTKVGRVNVNGKETALVYGVNLSTATDASALSDPSVRTVAPGLRSLTILGGGQVTIDSTNGESGLIVHAVTGLV
ncbi:glycoside hydrolase family 20 zincin-like fold domain-containing protein [Armatimonas sp.]|uniref:glycoside hydrolase family 20 zincin-like fold domain-containing protein n=1 Tax=Armatimonas sp. TaxID=1872638 RepID=UPI00286D404D|nr:glycoside hydrolase family 20 zincin-like fold domain-containing protein [Armatimonas sp.]